MVSCMRDAVDYCTELATLYAKGELSIEEVRSRIEGALDLCFAEGAEDCLETIATLKGIK